MIDFIYPVEIPFIVINHPILMIRIVLIAIVAVMFYPIVRKNIFLR